MPRPMTPTQLTVLTRASASAWRMSPCVYWITIELKVPSGQDINGRLVGGVRERGKGLALNLRGPDADALDQTPRDESPDEELGLLALLDVGIAEVAISDRRPVDLAELSEVTPERRVCGACV